jgi:hypothetical protein
MLFGGESLLDDDQIVRAVITFVIVGVLVPATLWYLGIRLRKPQLKAGGVIIGVTFVLLFGLNLGHEWFDWFPNVYQTDLQGPGQRAREASIVVAGRYPVNVTGSRHEMVLTPVAIYGDPAVGSVTLGYEVQSPSGLVVAKGRESLGSATGFSWKRLLKTTRAATWNPLKVEFVSPEEGEHKLILEIPKPVRKVRVEIAERKK